MLLTGRFTGRGCARGDGVSLLGIYFSMGEVEKKRIEDRGRMVMIMMVGLLNTLTRGISQAMKLGLVLLAVGIRPVKAIARI